MKILCEISLFILLIIGLNSCQKDEYGKEIDELLSEINYTKKEMLTGFSIYGNFTVCY